MWMANLLEITKILWNVKENGKNLKKKWMEKESKFLKFKDTAHMYNKIKESMSPWKPELNKGKNILVSEKWKFIKYSTHGPEKETGKERNYKWKSV